MDATTPRQHRRNRWASVDRLPDLVVFGVASEVGSGIVVVASGDEAASGEAMETEVVAAGMVGVVALDMVLTAHLMELLQVPEVDMVAVTEEVDGLMAVIEAVGTKIEDHAMPTTSLCRRGEVDIEIVTEGVEVGIVDRSGRMTAAVDTMTRGRGGGIDDGKAPTLTLYNV